MTEKQREYVPRINDGGNFCGHSPDSPRIALTQSTTDKRRPKILRTLQVRIRAYYDDPRALPSLNNANRSRRRQRSERREACLQLLTAILEFTDLTSLRCGVPTSSGFMSLTLPYLASYTGLSQRRAERAMADLKASNLISVSQPRQLKEDGSWRGLAAVKAVNRLLFGAFGLTRWLKHERDRAAKRLARKVKQVGGTLTSWSRNALVLGNAGKGKDALYKPKKPPEPPPEHNPAYSHARLDVLLALKATYPHMTAEECRNEADRIMMERAKA